MNDLSNLFSYRVWTCLSCHCPFECLSFPNTHPATYTAFKFNSVKKANASFINKKRRHWQHYKTLINGLENREQCCCCKRNKKRTWKTVWGWMSSEVIKACRADGFRSVIIWKMAWLHNIILDFTVLFAACVILGRFHYGDINFFNIYNYIDNFMAIDGMHEYGR